VGSAGPQFAVLAGLASFFCRMHLGHSGRMRETENGKWKSKWECRFCALSAFGAVL
jgi:hypothetical protein